MNNKKVSNNKNNNNKIKKIDKFFLLNKIQKKSRIINYLIVRNKILKLLRLTINNINTINL